MSAMPVPGADPAALGNLVQWLEEEQRQGKALVFKVQQELEQVQGGLWSLGDRLNAVEGAIGAVMAHGSRVARLEEDLRQTRELVERIQTHLDREQQDLSAEERQLQAELARERVARSEVQQRQEQFAREQTAQREKLQALEDANRRRQEELFKLEQALDPLRGQDEQLANRIASSQEQVKRLEQSLEELRQEQRSLQAQDEVAQGRLMHLSDQVRRLEHQEPLLELDQKLTNAITEQADLHRVERQRMERGIVEIQAAYEQYRATLDDLQQQVLQLHGKSQSTAQHLEQLRELLWELRGDLGEQLGAIATGEEQHRRRQIAELEQQIKELRAWNLKPPRS